MQPRRGSGVSRISIDRALIFSANHGADEVALYELTP